MAFKIIKRTKLPVPVKGAITDEDGKAVSFSFTLLCKRLNQSQLDEVLKNEDASIRDFLDDVTEGWESVNDSDNKPLEFNAENMDAVLREPGMRGVCFDAYLKAVGAVAKV